jgi:polyhydroxyalkanoate synthase
VGASTEPPFSSHNWQEYFQQQSKLWLANPQALQDLSALWAHQQIDPNLVEKFLAACKGYQRYQLASLNKKSSANNAQPFDKNLGQVLWSSHAMRLRVSADVDWQDTSRPLLLLTPSLINSAAIFDLQQGDGEQEESGQSFVGFLQQAGVTPVLLDWGMLQPAQQAWGLIDYLQGGLLPALAHLRALSGRSPDLLGYCMGGNLALAAASLQPSWVNRLILLATPWDFHAGNGAVQAEQLKAIWPWLEHELEKAGQLSVPTLQSLFLARDPAAVQDKFGRAMALEGAAWNNFVAVEDWLNDGVPLSSGVTRETFKGWFIDNTPHKGNWHLNNGNEGGTTVLPGRLPHPQLLVAAARDQLVPPSSTLALAQGNANVTIQMANTGHLGLMAGKSVVRQTWQPIVDWLHATQNG